MGPGPLDARFTAGHRGGSGEPLVLLHGFTDTWRTWELVLPALERSHDVLAPALAGHAGGPPLDGDDPAEALIGAVERAMDEAGFATAHIAGNSLGGYAALRLAARGRARSVVALAPAGGWAPGDDAYLEALDHFREMAPLVAQAAPHAEAIVATPEGRRRTAGYMAEALGAHPARPARAPDPRRRGVLRGRGARRERARARLAARPRARHLSAADRLGHGRPDPALAARGGALARRVPAGGLGRARRRRPRAPAGRAAAGRAADPGLHRALTASATLSVGRSGQRTAP